MRQNRLGHVHAERLERWLGKESLQGVLDASRGFYAPLQIGNIPGPGICVFNQEFYGAIAGGGFTSLSDLISEATVGGKQQQQMFSKAGSLAVSGSIASLWNVGTYPAAGGAPSNIPGGAVPTNSTAGAIPFTNAAGGDTLHITTVTSQGSAAPNTLLLYDRIFHAGNVLHTTTGNQAVSGVPTRHHTASTDTFGNFMFLEVTGTLGTTAHTATITYQDQANNTAEAAAAATVTVSSAATRIPFAQWFVPLNSGDTGIMAVTNIAFSAVSSGTSNLVMGWPMLLIPQPIANSAVIIDGINSAFSLVRIFDNACPALIEIKGVATATTYSGMITAVSG